MHTRVGWLDGRQQQPAARMDAGHSDLGMTIVREFKICGLKIAKCVRVLCGVLQLYDWTVTGTLSEKDDSRCVMTRVCLLRVLACRQFLSEFAKYRSCTVELYDLVQL